jgi:hypothetical protein
VFCNQTRRTLAQLLLLGAVLDYVIPQSAGCDLCSIYFASQAQGTMGTGWQVGIAEQFAAFETLQYEGEKTPNPTGQYLHSSISQILVSYNLTDRFGLQLNLPVIYRSFRRPEGFAIDQGSESGIGDLALAGSWTPYRKETEVFTFSSSLLGGLKLPTGRTDRLQEELHEVEVEDAPPSGIHGHDLTLGSGSVDGIVGGTFYTRWERFFFTANAQYAIRSEGDHHYQFANDLVWSGGPGGYPFMSHFGTLGIQALLSGETKGRDRFEGHTAEDTGITAVYLGPEISLTFVAKLSAHLGADFPLICDNTALQIVPDYRVRASLTWRF